MKEAEEANLFAYAEGAEGAKDEENDDENGDEAVEDDSEIRQEENLSEMLSKNMKLDDEKKVKSVIVDDATRSKMASEALASLQQKNSDLDDLDLDLDDVDMNNSEDDYLSDD
jgi:hypothetical protein